MNYLKKLTSTQNIEDIKKNPNHGKYFTTNDFNNLTRENFAERLKLAKLAELYFFQMMRNVLHTTANNSPSSNLKCHNSKIREKLKGSCLKQEKVILTLGNVVNFLIIYQLDTWSQDLNTYFTMKDCLFGAVKLNKNVDPNKYSYIGYRIRFDSRFFHF